MALMTEPRKFNKLILSNHVIIKKNITAITQLNFKNIDDDYLLKKC